jgi:hypothetical protein
MEDGPDLTGFSCDTVPQVFGMQRGSAPSRLCAMTCHLPKVLKSAVWFAR